MDFPIIFYDGDCGFCNRTVQYVLDHERKHETRFSALQSEFAKRFFREQGIPEADFSTFYFWNGTQMYVRSTGALKVTRLLKFPHSLAIVLQIIPTFIRDAFYNFVAARRKRIVNQQCALPTPEQRKRFLSE